ncbi:MAG: signal transduction histidine kinase with CheB and CheR, partial [Flaviaesturariibacter sp.]|nr:signal transduction histidine kinase with CheB and CheR [Flaviaesturariibacter sp.]
RDDMRSIVEAQEAANEELQSANEEIVSSNEELQSINEELETSKEEIESSNEELITINQELQVRNEQLAEAQEYTDAVFMTLRESLLILDSELRVKSANATFYKTYRLREEEVIGQQLFDLHNRAWNIPRLRELLEQIIPNNGHCYGFEISHSFPGIGDKVLLLNARKVQQKPRGSHQVLVAIEDVTEFKLAQQIISDREAWFRNMADNAPVMIWVTGANRLCTFVNKLFLEFRGVRLEDAIGNTWALDAHPDDIETCERIYNECFDEKRGFELNYRLKHRDGSYREVFTKARPNFTTEGHFTGFIGSCVELGENKII